MCVLSFTVLATEHLCCSLCGSRKCLFLVSPALWLSLPLSSLLCSPCCFSFSPGFFFVFVPCSFFVVLVPPLSPHSTRDSGNTPRKLPSSECCSSPNTNRKKPKRVDSKRLDRQKHSIRPKIPPISNKSRLKCPRIRNFSQRDCHTANDRRCFVSFLLFGFWIGRADGRECRAE